MQQRKRTQFKNEQGTLTNINKRLKVEEMVVRLKKE